MRRLTFIIVANLLIISSIYCQPKKATKLLQDGIETHDYVKIEKAIGDGAKQNDGLFFSVELNDMEMIKYFVEKGGDPTSCITEAVRKNNLDIVKYLVKNGAQFKPEKGLDLDGPVYLHYPKSSMKSLISYKGNKLFKNGEEYRFNAIVNDATNGGVFLYRLKEIEKGNPSLIIAIKNNNIKMLEFLLSTGLSAKDECIINPFDGFGNSNIEIESDVPPVPPTLLRPIQYALLSNASMDFVEMLQNFDSTRSYNYIITKSNVIFENHSDSILDVRMTDLGISITKKTINDNIFGAKVFIAFDNNNYQEIKFTSFPVYSTNNETKYGINVCRYYYNIFGDSIQPKELNIKIDINTFGKFVDIRDNEVYKTVKIGNQVMLAENLRYKISSGCSPYNNVESNVKKYGYLYSFDSAKNTAPEGWHLPSMEEWMELFKYAGNNIDDVREVLSLGGGSGFNLLRGGVKNIWGFSSFGKLDAFWSSTPTKNFVIWSTYSILFNTDVYTNDAPPKSGCSVRLFKDH